MQCNICQKNKDTLNLHPVNFGYVLPAQDITGIPVCKECYNDTIDDGFAEGQKII